MMFDSFEAYDVQETRRISREEGERAGRIEGEQLYLIKQVIKILTAGVLVAAVGAVIYGAFLYTTSEGSPDKIKKAREVWTNTVIGIIMFAFMVAITNFIIPGGVFD